MQCKGIGRRTGVVYPARGTQKDCLAPGAFRQDRPGRSDIANNLGSGDRSNDCTHRELLCCLLCSDSELWGARSGIIAERVARRNA